ncbi:MAG TPA: neutral zinc metallopeptidase [Gemmatimonadales bacterium]|nr:neutral zinc metallopeptidase [Gemmatimonadales bacterium]
MRWTPGGRSRNLEDRRGARGLGLGGLGIGGVAIALLIALFTGANPLEILGGGGGAGEYAPTGESAIADPGEEPMVEFVSFVLDDAQQVWRREFAELGESYRDARLVLFRDRVSSACGIAGSASGPFYCPGDHRVYIDLGFFRELQDRFGAPGDFAQAYVLAHEIGHHVQALLGINARVRELQEARPDAANELSVRLELQADCLAGVWGHSTAQRRLLEEGDVGEGLGAAAAVGDNRIQREATGTVHPESFTHGTSEQRMRWFRRGLEAGTVEACDTFEG